MNNRIGEFIEPSTVLHHDKRSKIVAIDQDGVIKRYSTTQVQLFIAQPSVLYDAIAERDIEKRYIELTPKEDEPTHEEKNIQLNVDSQSYGE